MKNIWYRCSNNINFIKSIHSCISGRSTNTAIISVESFIENHKNEEIFMWKQDYAT